MYIIGNMTQFAKSSTLWEKINEKLVEGGNIGPELALQCVLHPDQESLIKSCDEITANSPKGGCQKICFSFLPNCSHKCQKVCHMDDREHEFVQCKFPCEKILCSLGHKCPDVCHQPCSSCKTIVTHTFPCGHTHELKCGLISIFRCATLVEKELEHCKHKVKAPCYVSSPFCTKECLTRLDCGHKCLKRCHPFTDSHHERYKCYKNCENLAPNCPLKHKCLSKCYQDCPPCKRSVEQKFQCGHISKNVQCGKPYKICPTPCKKILPCKHLCPRLCGEECGGCMVKVNKTVPDCQHIAMVSLTKLILSVQT